MKIVAIIPAKNEARFIGKCLDSLLDQTSQLDRIIVVDDNSDDATLDIAREFEQKYPDQVKAIRRVSTEKRKTGGKIVQVFNYGLQFIDLSEYDAIAKFDADLSFSRDYIEKVRSEFISNSNAGIVGGVCYIESYGELRLERFANPDHVRGALKCYRRECFKDLGGLIEELGWDSIDEFLAMYHGWEVSVVEDAIVEHHRKTNKETGIIKAAYNSGYGIYRMRYGIILALVHGLKLMLKPPILIRGFSFILGFFKAIALRPKPYYDKDVGRFVRKYRWSKIMRKFGLSWI